MTTRRKHVLWAWAFAAAFVASCILMTAGYHGMKTDTTLHQAYFEQSRDNGPIFELVAGGILFWVAVAGIVHNVKWLLEEA
jgi:hypothetical protein